MTATAQQTRSSHFKRGSGVYTCRVCGHNTRDTGGDGAGVRLCDTCFELAGEENHISDSDGETYGSAGEVRNMLAFLDQRNGAGTAERCFSDVCAVVGYPSQPTPTPPSVLTSASGLGAPLSPSLSQQELKMTDTNATTTKPASNAPGVLKRTSAYQIDPTKVIRRVGWNPRFDFGEIEALAASLAANGMLVPIRVKRLGQAADGGRTFELIDGDRRLTAIELLIKQGKYAAAFPDGLPAIIVDKSQDDKTSLIQMFEANNYKLFLPMEEAAAYQRMRDDYKMTLKEICTATGRKQVHVTEMLNLMKADDALKEAVVSGKVGKTVAKQIATHAKGDATKQKELVEQATKAVTGTKDKARLKDKLAQAKQDKAKAAGRKLKLRALSDAQLSDIGQKMSDHLIALMEAQGLPVDTDLVGMFKADPMLVIAYTTGTLDALKVAAGGENDLVL